MAAEGDFVVTVGAIQYGTDYLVDGVADNVQIQAAINEVAAAGGGMVFLRAGTYDIKATLTFPFDAKVILKGEEFVKSATGTISGAALLASATLTDMVSASGVTNPSTNNDLTHGVHLEDLTLDGADTTTNLIKLSNVDNAVLNRLRLRRGTNSIKTVWDSSSDPSAATIPGAIFLSNCIVSANSGIGLDLQFQTQCWISNCWFTGTSVTDWIVFKGCNKIHLVNCEFNTATNGLKFQDTATFPCHNITSVGNVFQVGNGNRAWKDERTHASSGYTVISSSTLGAGVIYDQLAGVNNTVDTSNNHSLQGNVTGATTFNRINGKTISATLTGNITVTLSDGGFKGDILMLKLTQDGTGNRTATWPSNFKKAGGTLTLSTAAGAVDVIKAVFDGTNWNEVSRSLNLS